MKVLNFKEYNESVSNDKSIEQLVKVRKASKGTDIGDRISDMNTEGANIINIKNVLDTDIESREDYDENNKKIIPYDSTKLGGAVC